METYLLCYNACWVAYLFFDPQCQCDSTDSTVARMIEVINKF